RLKPEQMNQFDVGLQFDYQRFKGGVSGFYGWVHNYITFDQNNSGPGLTQVVFTNTDLATLAGGEMYAQVELADWLTGFGTMTYVQGIDQTHSDRRRAANLASSRRTDPATGQFATETEPLPQIPPLDTRLGFRIHQAAPERRWQVEFSARIVNGQNAVARSLGELPTPGFTVLTIRGYWQATDRLLLTGGVENFGNKLYREHLDPISGNILGVNPLFRPGTNFYFGSQLTY
ncbi:MAG TPA: TonB-dependent receptor, partial [Gemmataceae bacterium]|nr:TonB-dependent receptor [Gemmataceae bacterium]